MSLLMRFTLPVCLSLFIVLHSSSFAAKPPAPPANARTIATLPDFPLAHLKMSLNPRLYKSLLISPLTAWVVAQAPANESSEPKMVHSEAGGVFDKLAMEMAKGWGGVGYNTTESRTQRPTLMVHLLIYKIVDGVMAVNFAHNDQAFYAGIQHSDVWVGVFKNGKWTRIGGTKIIRNFPDPTR
jgi:hypothetical protein